MLLCMCWNGEICKSLYCLFRCADCPQANDLRQWHDGRNSEYFVFTKILRAKKYHRDMGGPEGVF